MYHSGCRRDRAGRDPRSVVRRRRSPGLCSAASGPDQRAHSLEHGCSSEVPGTVRTNLRTDRARAAVASHDRALTQTFNQDDRSGADKQFWTGYLDELFSSRLTKADVQSNIRIQHEYHRRFHFTPEDLKGWPGRVLIAESDTDIIGPRRRQALRQAYPNAEIRTFHDAGHAPMFSRFDEYLAMVRQFLDCFLTVAAPKSAQ